MKLISIDVLSGYVLEEIIAKLLRDNGYMLLVDKEQDLDALEDDKHGLVVRGRGANHQVDALGQLLFSVPFSLPIRLFAEAKCHNDTIGVEVVRNALGLINDVNERCAADGTYQFPLRRYHYRYALFSASGFSPHAQSFALAHQISLIDLQGPAFSELLLRARTAADRLIRVVKSARRKNFPLKQMRETMRRALGTWSITEEDVRPGHSAGGQGADGLLQEDMLHIANELNDELSRSLVLGFPQGPFILVLQPDDPEAFDAFLRDSPSQIDVDIRFASRTGENGEWAMVPHADRGIVVRFGIPPLLEAWLLTDGQIDLNRVDRVKTTLLPDITIFHHGSEMTRLHYRRLAELQTLHDIFGSKVPKLRKTLKDPDSAFDKRSPGDAFYSSEMISATGLRPAVLPARHDLWMVEGVSDLIQRLDSAGLFWQIDVIRAAAGGEAGTGRVTREQALQLGRPYGETNIARLVKPINRVVSDMEREGLIGGSVVAPLRRIRAREGSQYEVPREFRKILGLTLPS